MAAVAAHPQLVGNAFVSQYYNVLHHSQHVVHRFYTDMSCLTRAECGPEGPVETVYSQNGIYDKIMSVDYSELRAEIKTVDCQDSYSGSVLVMVTGSLSNKAHRKRDFVQTFFLAPQEKGYYVLNDVFRYLDDPQLVKASNGGVREPAPAPPAAPVATPDARPEDPNESVLAVAEEESPPEEVYDVPDAEEADIEAAAEEIAQPSEATRTPPTPSEVEASPSADDFQGDHPKKSYASILGGPAAQKPATLPVEKPVAAPSPQAAPAPAPAPPPSMDHAEETENADGNGRSVYVKNLAVTITDAQLEEALRRFGPVKSVSIKRPQNFSYAFVEFEDVSSARAAVEASPIQIDGKPVQIEEKRPMGSRSFRGRGRGRTEGNRGGRSSGGYYSGGGRGERSNSGGGRGSYANEGGGSGRGGRGGGYRGSYHSNSNTNTNNSNHNNNINNASDERYQQQQQQRYENQNQNGAGAQAHQPSRRKHYRNASFNRGSSGGGPVAAAATAAAAPASAVTAP